MCKSGYGKFKVLRLGSGTCLDVSRKEPTHKLVVSDFTQDFENTTWLCAPVPLNIFRLFRRPISTLESIVLVIYELSRLTTRKLGGLWEMHCSSKFVDENSAGYDAPAGIKRAIQSHK